METLINIQFGYIFEETEKRPDQLATEINRIFQTTFDAVPLILPVPEETAFDDFPIAQLKSTNGIYNCNVSRSRIDLLIKGNGIETFKTVYDATADIRTKIIKTISEKKRAKRLAFIVRYFIQDDSKGQIITKLMTEDIKKLIIGDSFESVINYVSRLNFEGSKINNYLLVEPNEAKIVGTDKIQNGVQITRDFNTVIGTQYNETLGYALFQKLIDLGIENLHLDEIKKLLWPKKVQP